MTPIKPALSGLLLAVGTSTLACLPGYGPDNYHERPVAQPDIHITRCGDNSIYRGDEQLAEPGEQVEDLALHSGEVVTTLTEDRIRIRHDVSNPASPARISITLSAGHMNAPFPEWEAALSPVDDSILVSAPAAGIKKFVPLPGVVDKIDARFLIAPNNTLEFGIAPSSAAMRVSTLHFYDALRQARALCKNQTAGSQ